jgi:predicted cobalt transporter CbtA
MPTMMRTLLVRGMLVGVVAGVLALGFASLYGEPQVNRAIDFEYQQARAAGEPPEVEEISRGVQRSFGLATGLIVYGVAFGGLFALAFAVAFGRIGPAGPRATATLVALGGFVALVLVPFLKYPANPPSVGDADTIGRRTELYFGLLLISVVVLALAVQIGRQLAPRFGAWNATIIAGVVFVIAVAVVEFALPTVDEVPPEFPATLLWRFRLAALGTQAVLWATIGLLFGALTERSLATGRSPLSRPARNAV